MGIIFEIIVYILLALIMVFILFWRLYFLRDPIRHITSGNNLVSPADGKVIKILRIEGEESKTIRKGLLGRIKTRTEDVAKSVSIISIFMSPLNVHINRSPMQGKIIFQKHKKGRFHKAFKFEKCFIENESNEIIIDNSKFKIKVIQIAGALARRIVSYVNKGDNVMKGQRIGLINLGSQVSLIIPSELKIKVKEGEKVVAGESIVAEIK